MIGSNKILFGEALQQFFWQVVSHFKGWSEIMQFKPSVLLLPIMDCESAIEIPLL